MSVIWSGVTEEGAVVPVQVDETGKVIATAAVPGGDYVKKTGDNMTGDLTLGTDQIDLNASGGSASFAGRINTEVGVRATNVNDSGFAYLASSSVNGLSLYASDDITKTIELGWDGSASFVSTVSVNKTNRLFTEIKDESNIAERPLKLTVAYDSSVSGFQNAYAFQAYDFAKSIDVFSVLADGSATFAGGKCGFTSAGELFFTSRNSRYKLVVQDQLVLAEPYTRQMELKEKAEQFIADKRETKPSDPSDPSDPQGGVSMGIDNSSPKRD